ncbi:MAG TPA: hypothetical protein VNG04_08235 [Candidatus Acidoferrum sp.]|nr:hypothetical protein [Candidatus Acidoferrum sp.]
MSRGDVEREVLDQAREARRLAFGKLQHEARQGRGVDDGMFKRALEPTTDQPCIEGIVAVLDQHGAVRETQEGAARVAKLGCADEHRTVDVMAAVGVGVDGRLAIDEGVEKGERAVQPEPLGADLQHEKRRVSGGLDVEGDELRVLEPCLRPDLGRIDRDLLPRHRLHGPARFEKDGFQSLVRAHLDSARARRAQSISSLVNPRSRRTAVA